MHLADQARKAPAPVTPSYSPTGVAAMARQHPMVEHTPDDQARLDKAKERQERKAAKHATLAVIDERQHKPNLSRVEGTVVDRAEQRRIEKIMRKAMS